MRKKTLVAIAGAAAIAASMAVATPAQAAFVKNCDLYAIGDTGFGTCSGATIDSGRYIQWRIKVDCAWSTDVYSNWYYLNGTPRTVSASCGGFAARGAEFQHQLV
ncbi:hypothetical protein [Plantactinospora sp. CA-290183]|uniref:hypothetical protein n=1 Tax=Plantactinospora sp. CA-290183 TaxID=3240006 RepID=UPI003D8E7FA9